MLRTPCRRRRTDRCDRLPSRPVLPERGSPASGSGDRGAHRAGASDRSERTQLRYGSAAWCPRARAGRQRPVSCRHQELRPRADLPHDYWLRTGTFDRSRHRWRSRSGRTRRARTSGDGRLHARRRRNWRGRFRMLRWPGPRRRDACCAQDADAKAVGKTGCGCS